VRSAKAAQDYATVSTTVSFAAGDATAKMVPVTIANDTAFEADETLTLNLPAPGGGASVGANEASNATGVGGNQTNNDAKVAGAVYLFTRSGSGALWSQPTYVKASNAEEFDAFSVSVALSAEGTLAVGAFGEDSNATVIGGDQTNNDAAFAGAVYLY
jgi:hypothetical protein